MSKLRELLNSYKSAVSVGDSFDAHVALSSQMVDAAPEIADLMDAARNVKTLLTREHLGDLSESVIALDKKLGGG